MLGLLSRAFLFLIVSFAAEGLYLNCWMSFGSRGHGLFDAETFLIEGGVLFGAALGLFLEDLGDVGWWYVHGPVLKMLSRLNNGRRHT